MAVTLVLGGARSGKSAYAQQAAEKASATGGRLVMLATAEALDDEMQARIDKHKADRGGAWHTVEAATSLPQAILKLQSNDIAVVDCLTLWISNLMMRERNVEQGIAALLTAVSNARCPLWLVSNEVGMGIVPENALAREFRDHCGRMHQQLAAGADSVVMVVAGLPLIVK